MRRTLFAVLLLAAVLFAAGACGKQKDEGIYKYLGEIEYDSPVTAFVYEKIEGEDEYGIQYRNVKDIDGLTASGYPVCFYFYSSMASDSFGITAGAEDIAQMGWGSVVVVMVDVLESNEIASQYKIEKVPEFVLVRQNNEISRFEGYNYEVWTMNDVAEWIQKNGIKLDASKLD